MANFSNSKKSFITPVGQSEQGSNKLEQFLNANQGMLIVGILLLASLPFIYIIYQGIAEGRAHESGSALVLSKKIEEYEKVNKTWPGSHSAASTAPFVAELQWAKSKKEDSIETLREFIESQPDHPALASSRLNLALKLFSEGNKEEAREILLSLVEDDGVSYLSPLACIYLGDIAKGQGDTEQAVEWYKRASEITQNSRNVFSFFAEQKHAIANANPPGKIKPKLPEPSSLNESKETPTPVLEVEITPSEAINEKQ